jgi:hypothetical protein
LLKSIVSLNINFDGSFLIAVQNPKSAEIILNLKYPIKTATWNPNQCPTKIVVYNVPPEIPIPELKEGFLGRAGNTIPVEDVTQLGKPDFNGLKQANLSYLH